MRKAKRHEPPSRVKYNAANPVIGVRVDRATHDRLRALRAKTGMSYGAQVRDALGVIEKDIEQIRAHAVEEARGLARTLGYNEGYKAARTRYRLTFACADCEEEIQIIAGSESAAAATDALTEQGWGHPSCHP